jgi:hypothetical protein
MPAAACLIIGCIYKVVKKNLVVGYERDEITYRRGTWHPCSWPWAIGQRSDAVLRPIATDDTAADRGQLHDRRYVRKASTTQDREGAASLCYSAMLPCTCLSSTFLAPQKGREVCFNVHSILCVIQHVTLVEQGHFAGSVSVGKCIIAGQAMLTAEIQTPGNCIDSPLLPVPALRVREQSTRTFRIRTFDQPDSTLGCHTPYSSMGSNTTRRCPTSGSD